MLLSAVSVLVVAQSSSEIPEGLMNNPVHHRNRSCLSRLVPNAASTSPVSKQTPTVHPSRNEKSYTNETQF